MATLSRNHLKVVLSEILKQVQDDDYLYFVIPSLFRYPVSILSSRLYFVILNLFQNLYYSAATNLQMASTPQGQWLLLLSVYENLTNPSPAPSKTHNPPNPPEFPTDKNNRSYHAQKSSTYPSASIDKPDSHNIRHSCLNPDLAPFGNIFSSLRRFWKNKLRENEIL